MSVIVDGKHINSLKKADEVIDQIFDEFEVTTNLLLKANEEEISRHFNECEKYEAQLKAKENDLEHQDMIIKCLTMDLDNKEKLLKAKDKEIERLKEFEEMVEWMELNSNRSLCDYYNNKDNA